MPNATIIVIVLIEGFLTIAAEVITLRQLIPIVGNSLIITSLTIGIFLLFLALGYHRGGQYKDSLNKVLLRNFVISAAIFGIGLSYKFIYEFFQFSSLYINSNYLISLMVYLLAVVAPLVYILGQTVPITMNLIKHNGNTGEIGGKILFISTLGSFLGATLTALILMNYVGVAWTIFIGFICFTVLVITINYYYTFNKFIPLSIMIIAGIFTYHFNVIYESITRTTSTAYANYNVLHNYKFNDIQGKMLVVNNSASSFLTEEMQGFPYIELVKKILFKEINLQNKEILVLGAGGFTISANNKNKNKFIYVDIDKNLKDVVEKEFLRKINGNLVVKDARLFLKLNNKKFDAIMSDAYNSKLSIPTHLLTREYIQEVYENLKNNGYAVFNIIANHTLKDSYSKTVDNTIRSVFGSCNVIPENYGKPLTNIVYLCHKNSSDQNLAIYSDDLNKSDIDYFSLVSKK